MAGCRMRTALCALLLLSVLGCESSCRRAGDNSPSVLLITVDTLRPDRLSAYGYSRQTPHIDSVGKGGVIFENAVCDIPWTSGSMASVMTGTFSTQHGLRLSTERLADSHTTLAEILKTNGFTTGAVIGSYPLASIYGLNQGFDSYDEDFSHAIMRPADSPGDAARRVPLPDTLGDTIANAKWADQKMRNDAFRPDSAVTARAATWLKANQGKRFFLWVHYFGPHERLVSKQRVSHQEARIIADYDEDLEKSDAAVGGLLAALKEVVDEEDAIVVLHSDHGQSLGEHGYVGHGLDLYDASIRIPLMVRFPGGIPEGRRVRRLARNVDILPTILDLLRIEVPKGLNGRSLVALFEQGGDLPEVEAYAETYTPTVIPVPLAISDVGWVLGPVAKFALRGERWKVIESQVSDPCVRGTTPYRSAVGPCYDCWEFENRQSVEPQECTRLRREELYDLSADPGETNDLVQAQAPLRAEMMQRLHGAAKRVGRAEHLKLSPSDAERLRSLGYHAGEE